MEELCNTGINGVNKPLIPNFIYIHMPHIFQHSKLNMKCKSILCYEYVHPILPYWTIWVNRL